MTHGELLIAVVAAVTCGGAGVLTAAVTYHRVSRKLTELRHQFHHLATSEGGHDPRAVRDVGIVRFDALDEMSGQLSFSIALLNAAGDGVVITSINARTETRTYAKVVAQGRGLQPLSPEEQHAVRAARLGQGPPLAVVETRRRTIRLVGPAPADLDGERAPS